MSVAYINRIATAVPPHDVHQTFLHFASGLLQHDAGKLALFERLSQKAEIGHRYSWLAPGQLENQGGLAAEGFYRPGDFPGTAQRMRVFERYAPQLAQTAIERLGPTAEPDSISHLLITCCTGFSAPGLDFQIIERCGLSPTIERTMVGFMGCYAAMNALKLARHIVRSEPHARVLVVNLELCSLHLQESLDLEDILSFMIFSDGCAASVVSAEPTGIAIESFTTLFAPDTADLITWRIGDSGFLMELSGRVPRTIRGALREQAHVIGAANPSEIDHWAVHPGGRSILDAVEQGLGLNQGALAWSRDILRKFGNMSSASVMFVLEQIMRVAEHGSRGCAMSFGPGLVAETMKFTAAG
ncbi:MAG TPA: type III polyketide synthase [Micropepsaceae bacterium]|nr:type III polyketide synthase [Micropepsaceae bacterium]